MTTEPKARRIGRPALIPAALALAGSTAFVTWWTTSLVGLPDVGDPFDVRAFERPIPDDSNAYVLYRQAAALLPKEPEKLSDDWSTAPRDHREWLDRCDEALELWREGARRFDALNLDPAVATFETPNATSRAVKTLGRAAILRGSRLESEGDFEGAFRWYHALFRSSRHCGRRAGFIERLHGSAMHEQACRRLMRWAAEPRVDAGLLRRALDAAIEAGAATPPISDTFKAEYLIFLHSIADPGLIAKLHDYEVVPDDKGGATTLYGQHPWKSTLARVRRRVLDEPERSRRVARLIFANWLAYCDLPPSRRPPKALPGWSGASASSPSRMILGNLFVVGDDAPASARALPADMIANWYASTVDASGVGLPTLINVERTFARERSVQGALLVALANELHKREHGRYPEHVEELVGPYLKALPEGYPTSQ